MAGSDIIVLSDILQRDLYTHTNIADVVAELDDLAANLNRSVLFYAWKVGEFASNEKKLLSQFNVDSAAGLAKILKKSAQTVSRYKTVYKLLKAPEQVKRLGMLGVSINTVLKLADIYNNGYKEECAKLLEAVMNNDISAAKEVDAEFTALLMNTRNLLPGEDEQAVSVDSSLQEDADSAESENTSPADKLVGTNAESSAAGDDDDEDDEVQDTSDDGSQNRRDAQTMLRQVRQNVAAINRDLTSIDRDLKEEIDRLFEMQSVILGDPDSSEEFDDIMEAMYRLAVQTTKTLIEQLQRGVESGYIHRQTEIPESASEAFNGLGLFS